MPTTAMSKEEIKKYKDFMYNPNNEGNCSECPENEGYEGKLPCGQQNCWVTCHCQSK